MVDASFVEEPRQRNRKAENKKFKAGKGNELWNDQPHKRLQENIDARWTEKEEENFTTTKATQK